MVPLKLALPFLLACTCSGSLASESCSGGACEEEASLLQMLRAGLVKTKQSPVLPNDKCPAKIVGKDWVENWVSPAVDDDSWANERDCYNMTRKDYKTGLSEFSTMFSGVQSCLEANQEMLIEMAFHNIVPPDDAPLPQGCHEDLPQPMAKASKKPCGKHRDLPSIQNQGCIDAWGASVLTALSLIFGVLGLQLPGGNTILADLLLDPSVDFFSSVLAIIKEVVGDGDSSIVGAVKGVWDIFMAANHENLIAVAMWEALKALNWWKRMIFGLRAAATIALWKLSAGVGVWVSIWQAVLVAASAYDLRESWNDVWAKCFAASTTTIAALLLDNPMNEAEE